MLEIFKISFLKPAKHPSQKIFCSLYISKLDRTKTYMENVEHIDIANIYVVIKVIEADYVHIFSSAVQNFLDCISK